MAEALSHAAPMATPHENQNYVKALLTALVQLGGSDLHLAAARPPIFRIHGELRQVDQYPMLPEENIKEMLLSIMPAQNQEELVQEKDTDFAHTIEGLGRFRVNVFTQLNGLSTVIRQIPTIVPSVDALRLPDAIRRFTELKRGLVLVTGPTGSGKSTTLAAMIDLINTKRTDHILTLEDPIEFVHTPKLAHINQREIRTHAKSFTRSLRAALREDPDVILVGELRDYETIDLATTAAETGHLVFGTLHTNSAPKTLDRIVSSFPGDRQSQIRTQLSDTLKGVISQQLLRRKDGSGRVAAFEILVTNPAISNLIREGKPSANLISTMETADTKLGMVTMDRSLAKLVKTGIVDYETAKNSCISIEAFERSYKGAEASTMGARPV